MTQTDQDELCSECGEKLLMLGEWELLGGICPNWSKHEREAHNE